MEHSNPAITERPIPPNVEAVTCLPDILERALSLKFNANKLELIVMKKPITVPINKDQTNKINRLLWNNNAPNPENIINSNEIINIVFFCKYCDNFPYKSVEIHMARLGRDIIICTIIIGESGNF